MSNFDPGRDPAHYPIPASMSDADLALTLPEIEERDHSLALAEFVLEDAAKAAASAALINLPPDIRSLFKAVKVEVTTEWSDAGCAVSNRFTDLYAERLARDRRRSA